MIPLFERRGQYRETPFPWWRCGDFLAAGDLAELTRTFPWQSLIARDTTDRRSTDKQYVNRSAPLYAEGMPGYPALPPIWQRLVADLASPSAFSALLLGLGVTAAPASLELRTVCHDTGGFLAPHTDGPEKLASVVIYLGNPAVPAEGGKLVLLSTESFQEREELAPTPGSAVAFARSDRSWHLVQSVIGATPRLSVLVHLHTDQGHE